MGGGAASYRRTRVIRRWWVLVAATDRRGCASPSSQDGDTPLMFAAMKGQAAVVPLLLDAGARVNMKDNVRRRPAAG